MKHRPSRLVPALLLAGALSVFSTIPRADAAGDLIPLTPDDANSSTPGFGSTTGATLNDPFAYDLDDPIAQLPALVYTAAVAFHGNEADGADVLLSYTFPEITLDADESFVIDLYGRDDVCCGARDDSLDIEFYSGGIGGTLVETQSDLGIPDGAPVHLRVIYTGAAAIDSIRIVAHDVETTDTRGSYFTLQEIRAAQLRPDIDNDGDGLPKDWEEANNLDDNDNGETDPNNGALGDPDSDQLSNIDEYNAKTDPQDEDSDDDTLLDGAEVTGAGSRPPTNPREADTDGDTLDDAAETNTGTFLSATDTGTDPTLPDSDADGATDGAEVGRGTNPTDPNSGISLTAGKAGGFFDAAGTAVESWAGLPASNITDGNPTSISHPLSMPAADFYYEIDLGEELTITNLAITGRTNCCPERLEDATFTVLDAARNEVFSLVLSGQITTTQEFNLSAIAPRGQFVRITNTSGADYGPQLGELAVFGSTTEPAPPAVTALTLDPETGDGSLTFSSQPSATYSVFGSPDFSNPIATWAEVNDTVPSGGTSTTTVFRDLDMTGQSRYFYIVLKNPPAPPE